MAREEREQPSEGEEHGKSEGRREQGRYPEEDTP